MCAHRLAVREHPDINKSAHENEQAANTLDGKALP
jgi:hypothetical protein